jgi:hypothetical protein
MRRVVQRNDSMGCDYGSRQNHTLDIPQSNDHLAIIWRSSGDHLAITWLV